jgi:predicted membrane-bound spermidine synthase
MRRASILLALLLTVPTGASGLIYEVTWQRYLATLLGSQAASVALVLGVFLGSLALGYALLGRLAQVIVQRSTLS